jgi:hypothetical protein
MNKDLQLSFDVGHSSIGWAVLETRIDKSPSIIATGVVNFPSGDCQALSRRTKRRLRRNTRSRKQRIERMEYLLAGLGVLSREKLALQHAQGKGNTKGSGGGFSFPWLHAARILAAHPDDRANHLLTWEQLWDVLRWYAHNRGYDGNLRWSGDYRCDGLIEENTFSANAFDSAIENEAADLGASAGDGESKEDEKDKLAMGKRIMTDYGFATPTFAETVAKFLLGPERVVKPPKQPGMAGQLGEAKEGFTKSEFHRLLFGQGVQMAEQPKLRNYFKGLMAAFPRRHFKEGTRLLSGGTEWEVRMILRAHRNAPPGKARWSEELERALCGGTPEKRNDWEAFKARYPKLYLSDAEIEEVRKLMATKTDSKAEKQRKMKARKELRVGKLVLPKRYQGGLLFGQLVPRFDNRIISTCPVSYARKYAAFIKLAEGQAPRIDENVWDKDLLAEECRQFRERTGRPVANPHAAAKDYATVLSKVPAKASLEFLDYRWAMILANIKVRDKATGKMRALTASERKQLDDRVRARGVLEYERGSKDGKTKEVNELAQIVDDELKFKIAETNLDGFFIAPDMREGLKLVPLADGAKAKKAFQLVWKHLPENLRRRFTIQLLRGTSDKPRPLSIFEIRKQLEQLGDYGEQLKAIECDLEKQPALLHEKFTVKRPKGRARYHSSVLRQACIEVMRGEDPRKLARQRAMEPEKFESAEDKGADGCLVVTSAMLGALDTLPLAEKTNNHLVRHRITVLTGDPNAQPHPMRGLLDDIAREFVEPCGAKIGRITIEVTRDIQEMSGKGNEEKKEIEDAKHEEHDKLVEKLSKMFEERAEPVDLTAGIIKKARIAEDLLGDRRTLNWRCPYTGEDLNPSGLFDSEQDPRRLEKDHIIPDSKRHSNAIEAQVLTFRKVNQMKGNMTALAFIKKYGGQLVPGMESINKEGVRILKENEYRRLVEELPTKGATKSDRQRRIKRKEFLLTEHWSGEDFTPGDLTKTAHIIKLAAEQIRAKYRPLPEEERPEVIYIPGGVTHAFRDREWKLFGILSSVNEDVKAEMDKGNARFCLRFSGDSPAARASVKKQFKEAGKDVVTFLNKYEGAFLSPHERTTREQELKELLYDSDYPELAEAFYWARTSLNPKKAIRSLTHLHHAVDAIALGLISDLCVPKGHPGIHDTIARGVVFSSHNTAERNAFEAVRNQLGIRKFYRWGLERCDRPENALPGKGGTLCLNPLETEVQNQIRAALKEARFRRVIQYQRKSITGALLEQNIWGIDPVQDDPEVIKLHQHSPRQKDGTRKIKVAEESPTKLAGLKPPNENGKLKAVKGALVISENYGMALYPKRKKEDGGVFDIIPYFRVREQIGKLARDHRGRRPEILRRGQLVTFAEGKYAGRIWKIIGIEATGRIKFFEPDRAKKIDSPENFKKPMITTMLKDGLQILSCSLCGVAAQQAKI